MYQRAWCKLERFPTLFLDFRKHVHLEAKKSELFLRHARQFAVFSVTHSLKYWAGPKISIKLSDKFGSVVLLPSCFAPSSSSAGANLSLLYHTHSTLRFAQLHTYVLRAHSLESLSKSWSCKFIKGAIYISNNQFPFWRLKKNQLRNSLCFIHIFLSAAADSQRW